MKISNLKNRSMNFTFNKQKLNIYPEIDFKISKIIYDNQVHYATFNQSYNHYKNKEEFPWQVKISIETIISNNDHKLLTIEEMKILNYIEYSFQNFFDNHCIAHYLGRITRFGHRELYFYIDCKKLINKDETKLFINELNNLRKTILTIKKDECWNDILKFINKNT